MNCFPLIWNYGPELFGIGSYTVKAYPMLFALCFIIGRQMAIYMFQREGKDLKYVDTIITYIMVGTTLGARLGHVVFYDWHYYSQHLLEILLPFKFEPTIKFQGFAGLASHGAAIGIILVLFLYTKCSFNFSLKPFHFSAKLQNRPGQSFLWLIDRTVLVVALAGTLIRIGNFMNSEIYGEPTNARYGVIFVRNTVTKIKSSSNHAIDKISVTHNPSHTALNKDGFSPITLQIRFKQGITDEEVLRCFIENKVKKLLSTGNNTLENIAEPKASPLSYAIQKQNNAYVANINTIGIVRHPSQLYESITCIFVFILLMGIWKYRKYNPREGSLAGLFMTIVFTLRIIHEMLKEGEVVFSNSWLSITNAQMLSIPAILLGIIFYFWNFKEKPKISG